MLASASMAKCWAGCNVPKARDRPKDREREEKERRKEGRENEWQEKKERWLFGSVPYGHLIPGRQRSPPSRGTALVASSPTSAMEGCHADH